MPQNEILILGATGATGRHVLGLARDAGLNINLLSRDPSKLHDTRENEEITQGDARDIDALLRAMPEGGLVVSCLGIGPRGPKGFYSDTAKAIVSAAKQRSPRRSVILSTLGTGTTAHRRTPVLSGMFGMMGAGWILQDRGVEEDAYLESGMPVTLMQSCWLTNAKASARGKLHDPADVPSLGFLGPMISRADVGRHLMAVAKEEPRSPRTLCLLPE